MNPTKCQVCGSDNLDLAVRCASCGSILQDSVKSLDLFSTVYNLWSFPESTLRKVILATHRNYSVLLGILEGIGLSFVMFYVVKAADIYSVSFPRLIVAGISLGIAVYFPSILIFSLLAYLIFRVRRTGASLRGFVAGMLYTLHPVAIGAVFMLPLEVAVFGSYLFSNNPAPQVINPVSFYFLAFLDVVFGGAVLLSIWRLSKVLSRSWKFMAGTSGILAVIFAVASEVAKHILIQK